MQHFDMESTVFEKGGSLLYISVKKSFSTFLTFPSILVYISLSVIDNTVPFYMDAHIWWLNCKTQHFPMADEGVLARPLVDIAHSDFNRHTNLTVIFPNAVATSVKYTSKIHYFSNHFQYFPNQIYTIRHPPIYDFCVSPPLHKNLEHS